MLYKRFPQLVSLFLSKYLLDLTCSSYKQLFSYSSESTYNQMWAGLLFTIELACHATLHLVKIDNLNLVMTNEPTYDSDQVIRSTFLPKRII